MDEPLNVKVDIKGLDKELTELIKPIKPKISQALNSVGDMLKTDLQQKARQIWYLGYTPEVYKRRTDNPALGTPLTSEKNMAVDVTGTKLEFSYFPTGEHLNQGWHTDDGDNLIENIQRGALWGEPPARPFWNFFVEDNENFLLFEYFEYFMKPYKIVANDAERKLDLSESYLRAGDYQGQLPLETTNPNIIVGEEDTLEW